MGIMQTLQNRISQFPAGRVFGYQDLPSYRQSPDAVTQAMSRLVRQEKLVRLGKGKFYVPQKGVLGARTLSDSELLRSFLYKGGRLRGYITGLFLWNQLGLTPQVPRTYTVAVNGSRQEKDWGRIQIKTQVARVPITPENVQLLQYLDVLKDLKKIPDADPNQSLEMMGQKIKKLSPEKQDQLVDLAVTAYGPQVRALTGLLFTRLGIPVPECLRLSLNPTTTFSLGLDPLSWPEALQWNIRA
ncbi:MAG: hypothetical protein KDC71_18020 [Acidobacteria bacterium]|nr:hypothetical protein [Acidobacteriota bacterium]